MAGMMITGQIRLPTKKYEESMGVQALSRRRAAQHKRVASSSATQHAQHKKSSQLPRHNNMAYRPDYMNLAGLSKIQANSHATQHGMMITGQITCTWPD
jgi:hypothetical protein